MKIKTLFALSLIMILITACAQTTPTTVVNPTQAVPTTPPTHTYPPPGSNVPTPNAGPYPGPTALPTQASSSLAEQAASQAVSKKYNIPVDKITILNTEPMTWNNGCLGVVIPGVLCTQVIVNGYIVKLQGNSQQFEIHTNLDGTSVIDAAQQLATLSFVIRDPSQAIQVVNPNIPLGPTYNPALTGLPSLGGSISGTAYLIDAFKSSAVAVTSSSQQVLSFIQNPTYALAVWRGGLGTQPLLAWGTQPVGTDRATSLMIGNPDGSNLQTLLTISPNTQSPMQLVAEFWSADGKSLYFSKEPVGIGGYIPFPGFSNLYKIDIESKQVSDIIPQQAEVTPNPCIDAISLDYRFVADHCQQGVITVRDLQAGTTVKLQLPSDFTGYRLLGTARFSPSGDRVAFALAKGNPDDEKGWLAIGSSSGGTAKIIATSDSSNYYNVIGWLDDQTLLVQQFALGSAGAVNQVLTVTADGSVISKVTDGMLLSIVDNR